MEREKGDKEADAVRCLAWAAAQAASWPPQARVSGDRFRVGGSMRAKM